MNYKILNEEIVEFCMKGDDLQFSCPVFNRMYNDDSRLYFYTYKGTYNDFISCLESIEAAETIYDLWNRYSFLIRRTGKNQKLSD